ncbi:MAG: TIGR00266 family protein [Planctomycetota bacterium]|nr:TIGR00266 family protein [Planctomycetota bacterium]
MADQIDYEILGDDAQAVVIRLDPREAVRAEPGAFMWMEDGIEMETSTGGGIMSGLKRKLAGEKFFLTTFDNRGHDVRKVAFAGDFPDKIIPLDLAKTDIMCQRDAYLCSADGIEVTLAFTKRFGAGFLGGEGFFLQRLSGNGMAFVHAGGLIVEQELGRGESIRVDTGCLVAFEPSVDYDIRMIKGVKSMLFGGEGLFYAHMTGPGKVWIQTTPFSRFAGKVASAAGGGRGEVKRGIGLGILGGLIGGD